MGAAPLRIRVSAIREARRMVRTFLRAASVYRQNALFSGHSVLRPRPDGVVLGLFGFTVVPPPALPDCPGTWLSDVPGGFRPSGFRPGGFGPGGFRPGGYNDDDPGDDEPGVRGWACGRGVAGCRPVAGAMGVAGEMPDVLGAVDVRPDEPVVSPGDDSVDGGGCAGAAVSAGGDDWEGAAAWGVPCAGDPGTGVTVPGLGVCAAPVPIAATVSAVMTRRHRIVRIRLT